MRPTRAAARQAASKLKLDASGASDTDRSAASPPSSPQLSPSSASSSETSPPPPPSKRHKPNPKKPFPTSQQSSLPLSRPHPPSYHTPLLLTSQATRQSLQKWFTKAHDTRAMPWRKPFLPASSTSSALKSQRAYEVYISEIMLQQTRVATVIAYYNAWMARWPSLSLLASATEEDVLSAWRGLGYYSRARRILQAAKLVEDRMGGEFPSTVEELMKIPGVGRYTAGAIAAIVYGRPEAMVDGNVLRVLSRQVGLMGDVKDKNVGGMLWEVAGDLVKVVAADGEDEISERPGLWGQALMELGSTVCTPTPKCGMCPVTETCQAYQEGYALAMGTGETEVGDIEDLCRICEEVEEIGGDEEDGPVKGKRKGKKTMSSFFENGTDGEGKLEIIVNYARKFPLRKPKKQVREEETVVCAIRRVADGKFLIHRRPDKGLLASLWEFPSHILPVSNGSAAKARKTVAVESVDGLVASTQNSGKRKRAETSTARYLGELGSVPWLFSHLKLTMHVHLFEVDEGSRIPEGPRSRWASPEEIDKESMGTGMRKCWTLVKEQE
ncbi:g-specific adenine glycosylase [Echria macrotheca]|uniref:Adenine DNA glycosylase n=1 Tax=Echria macrotheca TaxID=438768 RepID=A0AAJ0F4L0_9PEZI|nr:g-specific adenine glycosylase [Echria macrotheca]